MVLVSWNWSVFLWVLSALPATAQIVTLLLRQGNRLFASHFLHTAGTKMRFVELWIPAERESLEHQQPENGSQDLGSGQ